MLFNQFIDQAQLFFLIFARIIAFCMVAPLFSSAAIPAIVRIALALFFAAAVLTMRSRLQMAIPESTTIYILLLVGEVILGLLFGFIINLFFTAFQVSGQLFSMQMGFAASQVLDPLAQIENPLLGQFTNLIAMLVMLQLGGFLQLLLRGLAGSFLAINASNLALNNERLIYTIAGGLAVMFGNALLIALPIIATLFLMSVAMGLAAKAAPQMNLLMLGFPLNIMVGLVLFFLLIPFLVESIGRIINGGFTQVWMLIDYLKINSIS